jgi:lipase chaperone LimK
MKRRNFIIYGILFSLAVISFFIVRFNYFSPMFSPGERKDVPVNSIIKGHKITFRDMKAYFKGNQFESGKEDPNKYFSQTIINQDTIKYFKFLQCEIKGENLEDHLNEVKTYIHSVMDSKKADEMFAFYQKFCAYEIDLAKKVKDWPQPKSAADMIQYLEAIQEYRREVFGAEAADALWAIEVKGQEYNIRRGAIIHDPNLYGVEKERQISALKAEMWGTGPDAMEDLPKNDPERYAKYQENEAIYKKDLEELPENLRKDKIVEFRKAVFTPEQLARLEKVDEEVEQEKLKENDYYVQENKFKMDQSMSRDQQEEAIRELQDQTFGDEAEAFRRRQNIGKDVDAVNIGK